MEGIDVVAQLMAISAKTAPKSKGEDFVAIKIIQDHDLWRLADTLRAYGQKSGKPDFDRDADGIASSSAVVLIGLKKATVLGLDCGACGFPRCKDLLAHPRTDGEFSGPTCALRMLDMGIALGSAVKTAAMLNVDNRIMYRAGVAAREAGLIDWDYAMGIPLSASGKNIFFDR